jgi:hypothetical protein
MEPPSATDMTPISGLIRLRLARFEFIDLRINYEWLRRLFERFVPGGDLSSGGKIEQAFAALRSVEVKSRYIVHIARRRVVERQTASALYPCHCIDNYIPEINQGPALGSDHIECSGYEFKCPKLGSKPPLEAGCSHQSRGQAGS